MEQNNLNWIAGYIWGIADDVLRDLFVRGKYRDVILPMTVLRRFDAVLEETLQHLAAEHHKEVATHLYGQEINAETYAICKADLLLKGEGDAADNIVGGPEYSTLANDAFPSHEFDFMLSNPPYGKSWKSDLERMGGKKHMRDLRFLIEHNGDPEYSLVTRSSDGQMLFLANKLSKMKQQTKSGSRIAEVHNGSSLFTGDAGQGESNIRRWIIENDWLEAIVALPLNMFYNTGIATYIWVLTNRKPDHRRGKVQLIDATRWYQPLRKNLGKKNCELGETDIQRICDVFMAFEENEQSKVFNNADFGYHKVTVERPLRIGGIDPDRAYKPKEIKALKETGERSEEAPPVIKKIHKKGVKPDPMRGLFETTIKGKPTVVEYEPDTDLRDTEQIPLIEKGGIEAFIEREVLPYAADAWYKGDSVKTGYEISFTRYFYKPQPMRTLEEIRADIRALEKETDGLLDEIIGEVPAHWRVAPIKRLLSRMDYGTSEASTEAGSIRVLTMGNIQNGEVIMPRFGGLNGIPDHLLLEHQDLLFTRTNGNPDLVGKVGIFRGQVSDKVSFASYLVRLRVKEFHDPQWLHMLLNSSAFWPFARSHALVNLQTKLNSTRYGQFSVPVPPFVEQSQTVERVAEESKALNTAITRTGREITLIQEYRTRLIADVVTGKLDVREATANLPDEPEDLLENGDDLPEDTDHILEEATP